MALINISMFAELAYNVFSIYVHLQISFIIELIDFLAL